MKREVDPAPGKDGPRHAAIAVLASLLAGERKWQDLSASELALLRGLPRVQALIEIGRSVRHESPEALLGLAKLARSAADCLHAREPDREAVADVRALAWAELANAYRACSDLRRSSQAMNRAIYWCQRGSGSGLLFARVADLLASLLAYQRRFPEGQELLAMVYRNHAEAGRWHLAGRALAKQGNLAMWEGSPAKAVALLRRAFDLLDPDRDPQLVVQTVWGMIWSLADLGHYRSARRLLWRSRVLLTEVTEPHRLRWLEGRIHEGLGDLSRAEAAFQQARAGFHEREQVYPAALVGLDLAALWARQGRVEDVYKLAEEMIATFRALRVAREAIASLLVLKKACLTGGQILDLIDLSVTLLRDLDRQPVRQH